MPQDPLPAGTSQRPWWLELTRYHWFVFVVAALGWLFDTMDQQLFNLARVPAMKALVGSTPGEDPKIVRERVAEFSGYATSIFLVGWALGGLGFGVLGDRIGRAKTMMITILVYSIFTGLSAFSRSFWDFALYRFLTGLGVGGEFAVGVALVAEVMPERARVFALGWLQSLSAVGNVTAALLSMGLGQLEQSGAIGHAWRWMFVIGALPALLALLIRRRLKEPERWQAVAHAGAGGATPQQLGSLKELLGDPTWRHHTLVGLLLAIAGVVGLWGIGFFVFDLLRSVFRHAFETQGLEPNVIEGKLTIWTGIASLFMNAGGFLGIHAFSWLTHRTSRRFAFLISFLAAMASTALTFGLLGKVLPGFLDVLWMIPLMGFCQLALFGGYAIYFPELFPTRLRSTGTSFCYNVGRLAAAVGPLTLGLLTSKVFHDYTDPMRWAGLSMCGIFLLGLAALPFAPETRGKPLPE